METFFLNIGSTIIGVIVGAIITWHFSKYYYMKAGHELAEESNEIRKLINCLIILEQNEKGAYTPKVDENGKLVTIIGHMSAKIQGTSNLSGNLQQK